MKLKEKSFAISSVDVFWKWEDMKLKLFYIIKRPDPEKTWTDKDWNVRPQFENALKYEFINVKDFPELKNLAWKSKNEICQVLLWKTIVTSTILNL